MPTDWTKIANLLKVVVIGLGVLILLGVALITYKIISRADDFVIESSDAYASATVKLPVGSRVVGITAEGEHLFLLIEDSSSRRRIITVDRQNGTLRGVLTVTPCVAC